MRDACINTAVSGKRCHYILPLTLPNKEIKKIDDDDEMLTDFQNSFTGRLSSKYTTL